MIDERHLIEPPVERSAAADSPPRTVRRCRPCVGVQRCPSPMCPQFLADQLGVLLWKPELGTWEFDDLASARNCRLEPISPLERENAVACSHRISVGTCSSFSKPSISMVWRASIEVMNLSRFRSATSEATKGW